jgi:hypothetical protein
VAPRLRLLCVPLLLCLSVGLLRADAIVMTMAMKASTIAEFFIENDRIRVELEIGVSELEAFRNLMPDPLYEKMGFESEPLKDRFTRFLSEDFVLGPPGGPPLEGWIEAIEGRRRVPRDTISGEPLPAGEDEGEPVIAATLVYPFAKQPPALTFRPPLNARGGAVSEIGFVVYHLGVPVNDFRYLGAGEVLNLDWDDPWFSRFDNRNLRRQYDAPLNAFLYVEPYEIRAEVIARPIDLQRWTDVGLQGRETIPVDIQEEVKRLSAEFLAQHVRLTVDGQPVEATLERVNFLRRTLRTSTIINPPEELSVWSATLGTIFVIPTDGLPQEVNWEWDLFAPKIPRVPGAATDEAGPLRFILQEDDNVLWWKNFLKSPTMPTLIDIEEPPPIYMRAIAPVGWVASILGFFLVVSQLRRLRREGTRPSPASVAAALILIAAGSVLAATRHGRVDDERAGAIVQALLHNVYRAFDFRAEETIYDVLDRSVAGDLLTRIYLETRRGLELQSQGGARAKVKQIELLDIGAEDRGGDRGFAAHCKWNVAGSVGHWGHIHQRTNQYEADFEVRPIDGEWKITGMEILQEERL